MDLFVSTADESVISTYMDMNKWVVENGQFKSEAKAEFANAADGWVAAYAKVHNRIVVTQEVYSENAKKRVPLPNVCQQFGVNYCDTFVMLHELDVQFDWEPP